MSITAPDDRITSYAPVVATTEFAADFPLFDNDDLIVIHDGVEREDFAVSATYAEGISTNAKAVFAVGITGDVKVVGRRSPHRTSRFNNGGPLPIRDFNLALDTLESENQEARRDIDQSLRLPYGADMSGLLSPEASRVLGWDEEGRLSNIDPGRFVEMTGFAPAQLVAVGGTYLRFLSSKMGDVLSAEDFGVQKGVGTDQSAAINDMVDAIAQVYTSYSADLKQVRHELDLGPGTIRIDNPITEIPVGIRVRGRGAEATKILAYGDFPVWSSQEFESDGVTKRYHNSMRFEDFAVISSDPANPSQAIRARGLIRNSAFERVGHQGCSVGFDIDESWTLQLRDCFGTGITGQTNHHITLGATVGGLIINGGRYDVADDFHLYAPGSDALELFICNDAAFQFGLKGGIKVLSARTVRIHSAFLEGNCIGNPSEYYLDLSGSGSTLSSCEVKDTVLNNRADANRNGLGIAKIDNFETVEYRERWVRNGVKDVPVIGPGCTRAELFVQSAVPLTSAELQHLTGPNAASASAVVRQVARPVQNFGKELATGNLSQTGTATFGRQGEASVMLGSRSSVATVQGHDGNTAKDVEINPAGGLLIVGARRKRLTSTASNHTPSTVNASVVMDTSAGGRVINLDLVSFTIPIGFTLTVFKPSGSNNVVFTPPAPTDTINGVAGNKAVAAAGEYTLTKQSATAWLLTYQAFA